MQIIYSPRFVKLYKRLDVQTKIKAEKKEMIFRKNPFDNRLQTHKLSGRFEGLWSFSVEVKYVRGKVVEYLRQRSPKHFEALVASGVIRSEQV